MPDRTTQARGGPRRGHRRAAGLLAACVLVAGWALGGAPTTLAAFTSAATAGNGTDHLRLTLTLPTTAPNTMQGLTSTLTYEFVAVQRAGTNR